MTLPIEVSTQARALPAGYAARPATLADIEAVVAVINASSRALLGADQVSVEEWTAEWQAPGFNLETSTRVISAPDGTLVGSAHLWDMPPHVQPEQFGRVHPAHTGRGLGSYLLAWAEGRARGLAAQAPATARVALQDWVNSLDTDTLALLRDQGHQHVRSNYRMVMALDPAVPPAAPEWPAGVGVRSFVPGQDERATLSVIRAAFRDHWGHVDSPFEEHLREWSQRQESDPSFDAGLWFLAVAGDEVIGTALSRLSLPADPGMGWVFSLGVLRPWRRRGIARALLQHCFVQLWQRGQPRVGLGVDAGSLTNAVQLYERAGMHADPQHLYQVWEKELRPGVDWATSELEE
jgi:mycothiol synthase